MTTPDSSATVQQGNKENLHGSSNDNKSESNTEERKNRLVDGALSATREGPKRSNDGQKRNHKRRNRRNHARNARSRSRSQPRKMNGPKDNDNRDGRHNDQGPASSNVHNNHRRNGNNRNPMTKTPDYRIVHQPKDEKLGVIQDDPRGNDPTRRITKKASHRGNGRNTESFDPASTLVRPDLRIQVGSNSSKTFNKPLKHDDVVIVPELFGEQDDWSLYYQLVKEMTQLQNDGNKGSEWIAWHEGAHLISKNPKGSKTFEMVIDRLCEYFSIRKESIGTRFNFYKDSSDWKPFHHDSAAFNPHRAKTQNITVGVSFGATRELAFIRAAEQQDGNKVKIYFPQTNNGVFSFGRDANILWKHGVNALHPDEQDGKGRISIILWGLAQNVIEEEGSPPLLGSDGHGPHAQQSGRHRNGNRRRSNHK